MFEHKILFHDVDISVDLLKDSDLNFRLIKKEFPEVVETMTGMGLDDKIKVFEAVKKAQGVLDYAIE